MDSKLTEVWYEKAKGIKIKVRWNDFVESITTETEGFPKARLWQMHFFELMSLKNTYSNIKELTITPQGDVLMVLELDEDVNADSFVEYVHNLYVGCNVSVNEVEFLNIATDDLCDEQDCYECYFMH